MSKPERKLEGKRKVAVIGAGPSGLAAAFGLSLPEARDQFEVHVYQMGWRAGGKASTGRNADKYNRVEQNGSHYLFGCYHNCFALARQAYDELGPEAGFGTLADNFTPCSVLVGSARAGEESEPSFIFFPTNLALPGTGARYAQPFDYLLMLFQLWLSFVLGIFNHGDDPTAASRFVGALFPLCPFQEKSPGRRIWGKVMRALLFLPALLVNRVLFPLLRRAGQDAGVRLVHPPRRGPQARAPTLAGGPARLAGRRRPGRRPALLGWPAHLVRPSAASAGAGAPGSSAWPSWPSCPPASAWASWPSSCGAQETSRPSTARTSASGSAGTAAARSPASRCS